MNGLTEHQKDKISRLSKQISMVADDVWYAFETSLMSDAKSSVYQLCQAVKDDEDLPENIKKDLLSILEDASNYISPSGGTGHEQRAQKAHFELGVAERYLKDILT